MIKNFKKNLLLWLKAMKYNIAGFCTEYKIPRRTLESWLRGERTPNISQIAKTGISIDWLIYRKSKPVFPFFAEKEEDAQMALENMFKDFIGLLEYILKGKLFDSLNIMLSSNSEGELKYGAHVILNLYSSLYFGTPPFPYSIYWLYLVENYLSIKGPFLYDFFSQLFPYVSISDIELAIEEFFADEEDLNEHTENERLEKIYAIAEFSPYALTPLITKEKAASFWKSILTQFYTGIKIRKLPLICFGHSTIYFGKECPVCRAIWSLIENEGEE